MEAGGTVAPTVQVARVVVVDVVDVVVVVTVDVVVDVVVVVVVGTHVHWQRMSYL